MKVRNTVLCGVFAALLCLCAWISVPAGDLSFTLQTFGVFLTLGLLGGRLGTVSILIYLLLGAAGISRTCLMATSSADSPSKGTRPVSIS